MLKALKKDLDSLKNPLQAKKLQRFFKTGPGEYGAGDIFLGIKVPDQRKVAKKYCHLGFSDLQMLLNSKIHEYRLVALLILVDKYEKNSKLQGQNLKLFKDIFDFYLKNTHHINNWDLVDLSAPKIVGDYLLSLPAASRWALLSRLAHSPDLWRRRLAVVSTLALIRDNHFAETLKLARLLLGDPHHLIHKAVGWMLREVGRRRQSALLDFLDAQARFMPRLMLRYSLEKMSPQRKKHYLAL